MKKSLVPAALIAAVFSYPAMAELRPEHEALMNRMTPLRYQCVENGLKGKACDQAEAIMKELDAAGVCYEAEQNPSYCKSPSTAKAKPEKESRFHDVASSPKIKPQIDRLIKGQDEWVDFVISKGGVEGPRKIVKIGGHQWSSYATCRSHMCSEYAINMIVSPDGTPYLYLHGSKQKSVILGKVPEAAKKELINAHKK